MGLKEKKKPLGHIKVKLCYTKIVTKKKEKGENKKRVCPKLAPVFIFFDRFTSANLFKLPPHTRVRVLSPR